MSKLCTLVLILILCSAIPTLPMVRGAEDSWTTLAPLPSIADLTRHAVEMELEVEEPEDHRPESVPYIPTRSIMR